jgi:hypothetical protein
MRSTPSRPFAAREGQRGAEPNREFATESHPHISGRQHHRMKNGDGQYSSRPQQCKPTIRWTSAYATSGTLART